MGLLSSTGSVKQVQQDITGRTAREISGCVPVASKVPAKILRHRRQSLSSGRSLIEGLGTYADITCLIGGEHGYLVN